MRLYLSVCVCAVVGWNGKRSRICSIELLIFVYSMPVGCVCVCEYVDIEEKQQNGQHNTHKT